MKTIIWLCTALFSVHVALGAPLLVADGQPRAEIVVAETPKRLAKLAASELQAYLEAISGATLPIVTEPSSDRLAIYVGESEYTKQLGIATDGLRHGAYHQKSGDTWLALVGGDRDYEPIEPWARNHKDRERAQQEWEQITGKSWHNPMDSVFRSYNRELDLWTFDEGGSLQAVYAWLRELGVRWYMPGELGEIVPQRATIQLPNVDRTVAPDMPYRSLRLGNVPHYSRDDYLWHLRLGLNDQDLAGSHGMREITSGEAMKQAHPEYYALYGGKRDTEFRGSGHACFSAKGLREETIAYARAVFDHFDLPAVSVFPQDGYRACGCEMCTGKSASELVWGFVNEVARELYKRHPDRYVVGGAYTTYQTAPETIETFSPNIVVRLSWMRPGLDDAERWEAYTTVVEEWLKRLPDKQFMRNSNIHWTASPDFPIIFPHSIAREFQYLKGHCLGEASSVPRIPQDRWQNVPLSHLNIYLIASYLWDADQPLDPLLDDYYTSFYGPAAEAMRDAFTFAEKTYPRKRKPTARQVSLKDSITLVKKVQAAREAAGDSIHGQRVQAILDNLTPLDKLEQELAEQIALGDPRKDARIAVAVAPGEDAPRYDLRELVSGKPVEVDTTFQVTWEGDAIVFDVHCDEPDMANIPITQDVWGGDSVAILLETQAHSYYHIEVNPDGALFDADRAEGRTNDMAQWQSRAEIETEKGEDFWRLRVRIPVVSVDVGADDPLHFVVGGKPTQAEPWFFQVGRSRGLDAERQVYGFSPTKGKRNYHQPLSFARLVTE